MTTNKQRNSKIFSLINIMVECSLKYRSLEIIRNCIWHKKSNYYHETSYYFTHLGINGKNPPGNYQSPINQKNMHTLLHFVA